MLILIISLTLGLSITWGIAFMERVDAFINCTREPSLWSLLLVGTMLFIHLLLLYAEGMLRSAASIDPWGSASYVWFSSCNGLC